MPHPHPTRAWDGQRQPIPTTTRRRILRSSPTCGLSYPGVCEGTPRVVDHRVGVADARAAGWDPADIDDPANLHAVCDACHALKTAAEQARGRARAQAARPKARPKPPHPGLRP